MENNKDNKDNNIQEKEIDKELLNNITNYDSIRKGAYNIRKNGEGIERKSKDIQCNIMAKQRIQTKKGWKKQANARGSNCKENLTKLKRTVESKEKKP